MSVLRVLHLVGAADSEFYDKLSRFYAPYCLEQTANPALYEFHIAYISPGGQWRFPTSLDPSAIAAANPMSLADAVQVLTELKIDVMVPQMFCIPGMTQYRSLFDMLSIPYVGNPAGLMAVVADKAMTKAVVAAAGVRVPQGEVVRGGGVRPSIDLPIVLKPLYGDNSLGVTLVKKAADYDAALQTVLTHSDEVLAEKFIELGREVRCGIIVQAGELVCLPLQEYPVNPDTQPIRSYADKLQENDDGSLGCSTKNSRPWVVDKSDPITERVWAEARKCHIALGCRHYSLFDFRIDPDGQPWFLEAGLYCCLAEKSVIAVMAKASGISLDTLFQSMLQNALQGRSGTTNGATSNINSGTAIMVER